MTSDKPVDRHEAEMRRMWGLHAAMWGIGRKLTKVYLVSRYSG